MADTQITASFHVIGASVQSSREGKRLLIRTSEHPALTFLFPSTVARAIGADLGARHLDADSVLTKKSQGAPRQRYSRITGDLLRKYEEISQLVDSHPERGAIARACREREIDTSHFWGWRTGRKNKAKRATAKLS